MLLILLMILIIALLSCGSTQGHSARGFTGVGRFPKLKTGNAEHCVIPSCLARATLLSGGHAVDDPRGLPQATHTAMTHDANTSKTPNTPKHHHMTPPHLLPVNLLVTPTRPNPSTYLYSMKPHLCVMSKRLLMPRCLSAPNIELPRSGLLSLSSSHAWPWGKQKRRPCAHNM